MIWAVVVAVLASLATAAYLMVSRRRRIPQPALELDDLPNIKHILPHIAGLTGSTVYRGNSAVPYQNGDLLDALMEAIGEAQQTVHFETFIWESGALEQRFVATLCKAAERGVVVRVLIDAIGGRTASKAQLDKLRANGVELAHYHPINRFSFRRFNNRTHRKLLIVDGETGFVFGHGIKDAWCGHAQDKYHWRDTGVRLRGPVVRALQLIFVEDWIGTGAKPPMEKHCFVEGSADEGSVTAHVVESSYRGGPSSVAFLYELAIACAQREIIIQNPYFAPDKHVLRLLAKAIDRGVQVHLMVPGKETDSPLLRRASHHLYGHLLKGGVNLYEFEPTLAHQKIVIVDDVWTHIGSTNFDARSLALNAEIGVGLLDSDLAAQLKRDYKQDLARCRQLDRAQWEQRSRAKRVVDWAAYQLHGQI